MSRPASPFAPPPDDLTADFPLERCERVAAHPSGELVAVSTGAVIELRHAQTGALVRAARADKRVRAMAFSPDGRWLLTAGSDRRASLFHASTGALEWVTPKLAGAAIDVAWLGGSERFAVASERGELWLVDRASMRPFARPLEANDDARFGGLAAGRDTGTLVVSRGTALAGFDATSGAKLFRLDEALEGPSRLALSPRGHILVAAHAGGVTLFDARSGRRGPTLPFTGRIERRSETGVRPIARAPDFTPRASFSPSGDLVAIVDPKGDLALLDAVRGAMLATAEDDGLALLDDVAWFADGLHFLVATRDDRIAIWRARPLERLLLARGGVAR